MKKRIAWNKNFKKLRCKFCNNKFETPYWKINQNKGKFCSIKCYSEFIYINARNFSKCINCKKEFIYKKSENRSGKFCSYRCSSLFMNSKNHPCWKGGRKISGYGYVLIHKRFGDKKYPYYLEHRIIIEKFIGRKLKRTEVVHHKNGIKTDNNIKNLMVFKNNGIHRKYEGNPLNVKKNEIIFK